MSNVLGAKFLSFYNQQLTSRATTTIKLILVQHYHHPHCPLHTGTDEEIEHAPKRAVPVADT